MFTYLLSSATGRDQTKVDPLTAAAIASANALATTRRRRRRSDAAIDELLVGLERRGRAHGDEPVGRGPAQPADAERFSDAIAMQLDHLLGRNIYDRTQVTGVGYHPPTSPTTGRPRPTTSTSRGPGCWSEAANPDADRMSCPR